MMNGTTLQELQETLISEYVYGAPDHDREASQASYQFGIQEFGKAIDQFRAHLELTYLPDANPRVKGTLWNKLWARHNDESLNYAELETLYADIAEVINLV